MQDDSVRPLEGTLVTQNAAADRTEIGFKCM